MGGQICRLHTQVDKAGLYGLGCGKDAAVLQAVHNVLRNDERGFVVLLCGGHGTVALKFAQIGAVRDRHAAAGRVISGGGKRLRHNGGQPVDQLFHGRSDSLSFDKQNN